MNSVSLFAVLVQRPYRTAFSNRRNALVYSFSLAHVIVTLGATFDSHIADHGYFLTLLLLWALLTVAIFMRHLWRHCCNSDVALQQERGEEEEEGEGDSTGTGADSTGAGRPCESEEEQQAQIEMGAMRAVAAGVRVQQGERGVAVLAPAGQAGHDSSTGVPAAVTAGPAMGADPRPVSGSNLTVLVTPSPAPPAATGAAEGREDSRSRSRSRAASDVSEVLHLHYNARDRGEHAAADGGAEARAEADAVSPASAADAASPSAGGAGSAAAAAGASLPSPSAVHAALVPELASPSASGHPQSQ